MRKNRILLVCNQYAESSPEIELSASTCTEQSYGWRIDCTVCAVCGVRNYQMDAACVLSHGCFEGALVPVGAIQPYYGILSRQRSNYDAATIKIAI
jgi:hypothetical protein